MNEHDALRTKLDAFSRRLAAAVEEFKGRGEFSARHEAMSDSLRKRGASIRQKLQSAIDRREEWNVLKYDIERDYADLAVDFEQFVRELDVDALNPHAPERPI